MSTTELSTVPDYGHSPAEIETHPALLAADRAPIGVETDADRSATKATNGDDGPPVSGHMVTSNLLQRAVEENQRLLATVRERDSTIARLRDVLARASCDLAGGDARAVMVRTAIDLALAAVSL